MIGLDTNVIVRYLVHDDPAQAAAAVRLVDSLSPEAPGFLSVVIIVELAWVLASSYHFKKPEIVLVLENLLRSKELVIERADVVSSALRTFTASRADFSDCLVERCANEAGCEFTVTFDQVAARGAGMRLIK